MARILSAAGPKPVTVEMLQADIAEGAPTNTCCWARFPTCAGTVRQAATRQCATTPPSLRKTLTLDNGNEFAQHEELKVNVGFRI